MDDDIDTLVGDDVNSTADSSVSHSFYSNSLFSMTRHGDISDDDYLHRLSMKKISQDKSSASAMVTNELMRASYRHKLKRLDDDMTDTSTHFDREDDDILDLLEMAKRLDDHGVSIDMSAFSSPKLPIPKQIDPPEENETQHGMMASQRNSRNKMYVSASNIPRDRYRRTNTDGNFKMRATEVDSKQQYTRRYTDSYYSGAEQRDYKRKPDPIGTGSNSNAGTHSEEEEPLIELARRMSNSCGIEDTSSIEGPNDEEYWVNSRHNSGISDGGSSGRNRARSRQRGRASSRKKSHAIPNDEGKQHTASGSKVSKMKGVFQLLAGKTHRKRDDSSSWDEGNNVRRRDRRRRRSSSRSMSRSKRSNSRSSRSNSGSLSSSYSRQSSRKSGNSRYSSSSRRHKHKRKNRSKLTVAEAVAYLNKTERERMTKSPSLSSLKSYASKKSSASRMSSTSRTSRKSIRSTVSSKSNGRRNTTVSKVVSAASGFKEKIRRRVVSEKANVYSNDYSDEESSCFSSSSVEYM